MHLPIRQAVFVFAAALVALLVCERRTAAGAEASGAPRLLLDMCGVSKGSVPSAFDHSKRLSEWGYNARLVQGSVTGIQTFDTLAPDLLPEGGAEREWVTTRVKELRRGIQEAHAAGIQAFVGTDLFVLPRRLVERFKGDLCDPQGRIDIHRQKTQEIFRALLRETFARLPELDGLVIRTGEIYLHDFPHHVASGNPKESARQGNSAILRGPETHVLILKILREEVCVRLNKTMVYRTWSFGANGFHESPKHYLAVTDAVDPHPKLIFSIKHQKGDFHQLTPFNPTLMIGRHRQIVEVQCQREAYGKGAHPYYVGAGVVDGWEEYDWLMKPGEARGLRDIIAHPLCAGVWTWSRGGGWEGPWIKNELWCALNAWVISQFARQPSRPEAEIFQEFAQKQLGLGLDDAGKFRELNLLSTRAVLRGQLTTLGARVDVWWARDHFLAAPDLSDFMRRGLVDKALAEKAEGVGMWQRIEELARQIHFADPATQEFVETSATYGRIKYAIIEQAWTLLMGEKTGQISSGPGREKLKVALARYDELWVQWRALEKSHPNCCATLYLGVAFDHKPGLEAAIERIRSGLEKPVVSTEVSPVWSSSASRNPAQDYR